MSGKLIITAAAGALLLATTGLASAQQRAFPQDRYYGGWGYYGGPRYYNYMATPTPFAPGYYGYAPGYYYRDGFSGWDW
jgi:hypothetical protein